MERKYRLGKRLALVFAVALLCTPLVAGKRSSGSGCKKSAKKVEYEQPVPAATVTDSGSPSPSPSY
jgi:hypothetical protein